MAEFAELFVGVPPELAFILGVGMVLMEASKIATCWVIVKFGLPLCKWLARSIIRLFKKKKPL